MKIETAIKELQITLAYRQGVGPPRELEALKLGIEALKRLKVARDEKVLANIHLLPGETEV